MPWGKLEHLYTPFRVEVSGTFELAKWIEILHPTPARGLFPKTEDWRGFRKTITTRPRYRYGAPFGFWDADTETGLFVVAIRNIQWQKSHVILGSGGGIVRESKIDNEWAELTKKREAVKAMLGLGV